MTKEKLAKLKFLANIPAWRTDNESVGLSDDMAIELQKLVRELLSSFDTMPSDDPAYKAANEAADYLHVNPWTHDEGVKVILNAIAKVTEANHKPCVHGTDETLNEWYNRINGTNSDPATEAAAWIVEKLCDPINYSGGLVDTKECLARSIRMSYAPMLMKLQWKIGSLQSIVDKLPKTADGVPCFPTMIVWTKRAGVFYACTIGNDWQAHVIKSSGMSQWSVSLDKTYSTYEKTIENTKS